MRSSAAIAQHKSRLVSAWRSLKATCATKTRRCAARGRALRHSFAADYRLWAPDPEEIMRANVEGTRVVMEAAQAAGAERIVYTSSVATLKLRDDGAPADETMPLAESEAIGAYKRSKIAAERLVEEMIGKGLPAVIVNPSTPVGPRDRAPTPTGRMIVEAASGRIPAFVDTGLNLVHVDDVAAGPSSARCSMAGSASAISSAGENMTLSELLGTIARLTGRPPPRIRLPRWPLYPARFRRRSDGAGDEARAFRYIGWPADVEASHVFHLGEGRT